MQLPGGWRVAQRIGKISVSSQNRERIVETPKLPLLRHVSKKLDGKIRRETKPNTGFTWVLNF